MPITGACPSRLMVRNSISPLLSPFHDPSKRTTTHEKGSFPFDVAFAVKLHQRR